MAQLLDFHDFVTHEDFFKTCPVHQDAASREAQLNYWDCNLNTACCALCVAARPFSTVLQVRRSSYHDVVKISDIARFADISGIQGYTINSSKVIFLRRRPQPRPPKGAVGASLCTVCSRHLQDVSQFCSLQCKLDSLAGVKNVSLRKLAAAAPGSGGSSASAAAAVAVVAAHSSGSSGGRSSGAAPETPSHVDSLRALEAVTSSDSESMAEFNPAKRRKGCPLRAPTQ